MKGNTVRGARTFRRSALTWSFALALLASVAAFSPSAHAAACLARAAVSRDGMPIKQHALVPDSEVPTYQALGFSIESCELTLEQARTAVDRLCASEAAKPTAANAQLAQRQRFSFNQLCISGRAAVAEATGFK